MLETTVNNETLIARLNVEAAKLPVITPEDDTIPFRISFLGYDKKNHAGLTARARTLRAWQQMRPYWREAALRHLTMPVITEPVKTVIDRLAMEELCLELKGVNYL